MYTKILYNLIPYFLLPFLAQYTTHAPINHLFHPEDIVPPWGHSSVYNDQLCQYVNESQTYILDDNKSHKCYQFIYFFLLFRLPAFVLEDGNIKYKQSYSFGRRRPKEDCLCFDVFQTHTHTRHSDSEIRKKKLISLTISEKFITRAIVRCH